MLAIIPARGGSKGLPGKNVRPLCGKPLIAYSIEAALGAKEVDRVIVSTDSPDIARVAGAFGADIPFMRPEELAQDASLAIDTYIYTVERIRREEGCAVDEIVVLLPTCPLRSSEDIDAAIRLFRAKSADSVISYYEAPHPVQWYKYMDDHGVLRSVLPEDGALANRQSERKSYLPNGAIYVFKYSMLKEQRVYYTDRSYPHIMPRNRSIDIDNIEDFDYAEYLLAKQRGTL